MTVSHEQIKKIAKNLSKIPITDEKIIGDIEGILKYVDMLQEIDTTGVEPTISVVSQVGTLRKDELIQKDALPSELLACSKQKVIGGQIAIGSIMH